MNQKLNIFKGSLTNYQLSEALEISMGQVEAVLNEEINIADLNTEVVNRIHHLEDTLFGMSKSSLNVLSI